MLTARMINDDLVCYAFVLCCLLEFYPCVYVGRVAYWLFLTVDGVFTIYGRDGIMEYNVYTVHSSNQSN
jgi:hypothetical protein